MAKRGVLSVLFPTLFLCAAASAQTAFTGSMNAERAGAVAARLLDGRVLVTGGFGRWSGQPVGYLASAELFDPRSSVFVNTGEMTAARCLHTATVLRSGDVLIAGGGAWINGAHTWRSADLYIAASGAFVSTGEMTMARQNHSATLLNDGTVLIAGGMNQETDTILSEAEIYDPATGQFTRIGDMSTPRHSHVAALLPDGRVLIAGGMNVLAIGAYSQSAEIYDPQTRSFERTGDLIGPHTEGALVLANGEVLLPGTDDQPAIFSYTEIYNPDSGTFRLAEPKWTAPWAATFALLPGGSVLIAGGGELFASDDMAIYDPSAPSLRGAGKLLTYRTQHAAVVLRDGRVLILGGDDGAAAGVTSSAEIYGTPITRRRAVVH